MDSVPRMWAAGLMLGRLRLVGVDVRGEKWHDPINGGGRRKGVGSRIDAGGHSCYDNRMGDSWGIRDTGIPGTGFPDSVPDSGDSGIPGIPPDSGDTQLNIDEKGKTRIKRVGCFVLTRRS
jgi:hypothetical protein